MNANQSWHRSVGGIYKHQSTHKQYGTKSKSWTHMDDRTAKTFNDETNKSSLQSGAELTRQGLERQKYSCH
jgi:hypothetical protein